MSEIITVPQERTPDTVAVEIRVLQQQARQMAVSYAIEIGRRLVEAKEMVSHGQWGQWLQEEVSYSKSTANNLMRLYQEYGSEQTDMFTDPEKRQALTDLSYTQALLLLAVPAEERADFAVENQIQNMSTRELEQLIQERDAARKEAAEKEVLLKSAEDSKEVLRSALNERLGKLELEARDSQDKAEIAQAKLEKAEADLEKVKNKAKQARQELKDLKENPVIPEDAMAKIRAEAEEAARKKVAAELEEQLADAAAQTEKARQAVQEAREAQRAAEKSAALADRDMVSFQMEFQTIQETWNRMAARLKSIGDREPETAEKLKAACSAVLDNWNRQLKL